MFLFFRQHIQGFRIKIETFFFIFANSGFKLRQMKLRQEYFKIEIFLQYFKIKDFYLFIKKLEKLIQTRKKRTLKFKNLKLNTYKVEMRNLK